MPMCVSTNFNNFHLRKRLACETYTNVLIDYLIERPCSESAKKIVQFAIENDTALYISSTSIINCFYILRKDFTVQELRELFIEILNLIDVVGTGKSNILSALNDSNFSDFEDCVQSDCAEDIKADFIITRNTKDFTNSKIPAITPEDFLSKVGY